MAVLLLAGVQQPKRSLQHGQLSRYGADRGTARYIPGVKVTLLPAGNAGLESFYAVQNQAMQHLHTR